MGDPFSFAVGTTGIVTLGLQICGGLITYCRAWRSHDRNIEEALERLTGLERTLRALSGILSAVEALDDNARDEVQVARDHIYACKGDLRKLNACLIELESISQPTGVLDKVHNVRLRSVSFFNKDKFKTLRNSVMGVQQQMANAMQILNM